MCHEGKITVWDFSYFFNSIYSKCVFFLFVFTLKGRLRLKLKLTAYNSANLCICNEPQKFDSLNNSFYRVHM